MQVNAKALNFTIILQVVLHEYHTHIKKRCGCWKQLQFTQHFCSVLHEYHLHTCAVSVSTYYLYISYCIALFICGANQLKVSIQVNAEATNFFVYSTLLRTYCNTVQLVYSCFADTYLHFIIVKFPFRLMLKH